MGNAQFVTFAQVAGLLAESGGTNTRTVEYAAAGAGTHTVGASPTGFVNVCAVGQGPGSGGGREANAATTGGGGGGGGENYAVFLGRFASGDTLSYVVGTGGLGATAASTAGAAGSSTTVAVAASQTITWASGAAGGSSDQGGAG